MIAPSRRLIASCLLLMAASLLISLLGLAQGPVPLTIDQVFSALFGDAPRNVAMVVNEWRLPRVLMALLIGAALGVSGAIFQSLTRNPLGSPDVMGFNTGAWSGVLVAMVLFGQNLTAIALAAMAGGVLTSLVVWLLAWRNGIETCRLIIIGIGVRAFHISARCASPSHCFCASVGTSQLPIHANMSSSPQRMPPAGAEAISATVSPSRRIATLRPPSRVCGWATLPASAMRNSPTRQPSRPSGANSSRRTSSS